MQRNSFNTGGNGYCPCRGDGGGRFREVTLPAERRPTSMQVQRFSTERQICCTDHLVKIYSDTVEEKDREVLEHWLSSYITVFDSFTWQDKKKHAKEFARLANIKVRCPCDRERVCTVLHTLRKALDGDILDTRPIAKAVLHVLIHLDVSVFRGDLSELLLHLAKSLAQTLNRCGVPTRELFDRHHDTFRALYQTCTIIHRIAPELPTCDCLRQRQNSLLEWLERFRDAPYYPFRFYAMLIEQCIHRFTERNETSALFETVQRLITGTVGVFDLYRGIRHIDPSAVGEGIQRLRAAFADDRLRRRSWFDWLQTFSFTATLCLTDPQRFLLFQDFLEQI